LALWSAVGGHVQVGIGPGVLVPVRRISFRKLGEHADISTSASAGWRRKAGIYKDSQGTFDIWFDDTAMIDVDVSLDINDEAILGIPMGNSGKSYSIPIVVQEVAFTANADSAEVIGVTCTWVGNGPVVDPAT
jgi:hypothetical protein